MNESIKLINVYYARLKSNSLQSFISIPLFPQQSMKRILKITHNSAKSTYKAKITETVNTLQTCS